MSFTHFVRLTQRTACLAACALATTTTTTATAQVAVKAGTLYTMHAPPITDGVVVINAQGKITAVGPASAITIPDGFEIIECAVAIPGLVDVRSTVGLTGIYNVDHDQDMLETSSPIQPELRATDAYNPREPLVGYLRSFGVTTAHVGHAPGKLISGQTAIVKTRGDTIDDAILVPEFAVTATLGPQATESGDKSPGTRGKQIAMLRQELIKAQKYVKDQTKEEPPARDLKLEALAAVLAEDSTTPLIVTANRAQDIASALRLGKEFGITIWIDSAAEAYTLTDDLLEANIPVLLHPTMTRYVGEAANGSYATAKTLRDAGVPFAIQSGYEAYVPKVRVILFEAAIAAGPGGLGRDDALRAITISAAEILGIADRVGSLAVGMDGDVAMYNGDPLEYTTHCIGTLIDGVRYEGERQYTIGYPGNGSPDQR